MADPGHTGEPGTGAGPFAGPRSGHGPDRRAVLAALLAGTAGASGALAGCGPEVVSAVGGPVATGPSTPPEPSPPTVTSAPPTSPPSSTPAPTTRTPTPTRTPSPAPTVPTLSPDGIVLAGAQLLFLAPLGPGWRKTLNPQTDQSTDLRTYYDNDVEHLHLIVEVMAPLGITAIDHARQLAATYTGKVSGYQQRAIGPGPHGGAVWAFTYLDATKGPLYAIDWFRVLPAFDAAIYLAGPPSAKASIQALWRAVVDSAQSSAPYQSPGADLTRTGSGGVSASARATLDGPLSSTTPSSPGR